MGKLTSNVNVDVDGVSTWFGPDYPDAGDPPEGSVTNPAAYEGGEDGEDMGKPRELLEAEADPTRAAGAESDEASASDAPQVESSPSRSRKPKED